MLLTRAALAGSLLLVLAHSGEGLAQATEDEIQRLQLLETTPLDSLVDRPWWGPRVPLHEALPGTTGSRAQDCGVCHAEIYAEWRTSAHAAAWVDPQFQAELHKDPEVAWICINCHVPAAGQQEEVVAWTPARGVRDVDRRDNPDYDPTWQQEGISCMACHWRDGAIAAPHADVDAPHPVVHAPDLLEADLCLSCHQADVRLEDALVCHFTTGQEWLEAGQTDSCPACHMPQVDRAVAPQSPIRRTGRHTWPGSLLPKVNPPPEGFAAVAASWEAGVEARLELPETAAPGQLVTAIVSLENVRAGHRVPTGDPERYLLLTTRVVAGTTGAGPVIAGARARLGQRWIWWPLARKLDDDRLAPGQVRSWEVPFVMPQEGARVELSLEHYRISPENAAFHGLADYATHRVVQRIEQGLLPTDRDDGGLPRDAAPR